MAVDLSIKGESSGKMLEHVVSRISWGGRKQSSNYWSFLGPAWQKIWLEICFITFPAEKMLTLTSYAALVYTSAANKYIIYHCENDFAAHPLAIAIKHATV